MLCYVMLHSFIKVCLYNIPYLLVTKLSHMLHSINQTEYLVS